MLERLKKLLRVITLNTEITDVHESMNSTFYDIFDYAISCYIKNPENYSQRDLLDSLDVIKEYDKNNNTSYYLTLVKKYSLDRFI